MNGNDCDGSGDRSEDPNSNRHANKQPDGKSPTLGQPVSESGVEDGAGAEDVVINLVSSDSEDEVVYLGEVQGVVEAGVEEEGGAMLNEVPAEEEEAMVVDGSDDETDDSVMLNSDSSVADTTWSSVEWEGHQCICRCRPGPICSCEDCENCEFFTLKTEYEGDCNE